MCMTHLYITITGIIFVVLYNTDSGVKILTLTGNHEWDGKWVRQIDGEHAQRNNEKRHGRAVSQAEKA